MSATIRLGIVVALAAPLAFGAGTAGAASVELLRTGEPLAPSGSACFAGDQKIRPGGPASPVRVYGRSAPGQGARQGRLQVRDASRFELNGGQEPLVSFVEAPSTPTASGNTPYSFQLGAKSGTPVGTFTVVFQVRVTDGSLSNEVSCRVTVVSGLATVGPQTPAVVEANPYTLEVRPSSFAPAAPGGGPLGGITTGTQRGAGPPPATTETLINLDVHLKPGRPEPPATTRRCRFEAVDATGTVRFTHENQCRAVETRLPAGTYTLRLGFGLSNTTDRFWAADVRGYLVTPVFAQTLPPEALSCVQPCRFTEGVCVWLRSVGGQAFECARPSDCQPGRACVARMCVEICPPGVGCPPSCEMVGGACTEKPPLVQFSRRECATSSDCSPGFFCRNTECRRPCP